MAKFDGENPERGIIEVDNAQGNCFICTELTKYADVDYQAWMCSTECQDELDRRANYGTSTI